MLLRANPCCTVWLNQHSGVDGQLKDISFLFSVSGCIYRQTLFITMTMVTKQTSNIVIFIILSRYLQVLGMIVVKIGYYYSVRMV